MRRPLRLLALLSALAVVGVAACAPYHAGAAATVGTDRITTSQLRGLTEDVLAEQPSGGSGQATQTQVQQQGLGMLISLHVLRRMASRSGVTVTSEKVGAARSDLQTVVLQNLYQGQIPTTLTPVQQAAQATQAAAAEYGIDLGTLAQVSAYVDAVVAAQPVTQQQLLTAFGQESDHTRYEVRTLTTTSLTAAESAVQRLTATPMAIDAVAATLGDAPPPTVSLTSDQLSHGTPPSTPYVVGSVVPGSTSSGAYAIQVVVAIRSATAADAEAPNSQERQTVQQQEFPAAYAAAAKALGVHVSPRFGTWDARGTDVLSEPIGSVGAGGTQLSVDLGTTLSPSATPTSPQTAGS